MGKVIASLILQDYEDVAAMLDNIAERSEEDSEDFWSRLKSAYDGFHERRK